MKTTIASECKKRGIMGLKFTCCSEGSQASNPPPPQEKRSSRKSKLLPSLETEKEHDEDLKQIDRTSLTVQTQITDQSNQIPNVKTQP